MVVFNISLAESGCKSHALEPLVRDALPGYSLGD
jgi:hypothetical protein